jgi:hypothetical protein
MAAVRSAMSPQPIRRTRNTVDAQESFALLALWKCRKSL